MKQKFERMTAKEFREQYTKPVSLKNQRRGYLNREQGLAFEKLIEDSCEHYRAAGRADISKTPEPLKVIKRLSNNLFECCFIKKAQPDFNGVVKGGRAVSFEAKHTMDSLIRQSVVSVDQSAVLQRKHEMGANCFVLVGFQMQNFYRIPWSSWRLMKVVYGRKYISQSELGKYRISLDERGILGFLD